VITIENGTILIDVKQGIAEKQKQFANGTETRNRRIEHMIIGETEKISAIRILMAGFIDT